MNSRPITAISIPHSRPERSERIIEILDGIPKEQRRYIQLIVLIDHPEISLEFFENKLVGFKELIVKTTKRKSFREGSILERRERIGIIYGLIASLANSLQVHPDYVFTIEDDTETSPVQIMRFIDKFNEIPRSSAFVNPAVVLSNEVIQSMSGVQVGRWGADIIGAWILSADFNTWRTIPYMNGGIQEVTATGLFFTIHKAETFISFPWASYNPNEFPLGPDVFYGYQNVTKNLASVINWDEPVGHDTGRFILRPKKNVHIVTMRRESGWKVEISSSGRS